MPHSSARDELTFGCPAIGELVEFYADLGESADYETLNKIWLRSSARDLQAAVKTAGEALDQVIAAETKVKAAAESAAVAAKAGVPDITSVVAATNDASDNAKAAVNAVKAVAGKVEAEDGEHIVLQKRDDNGKLVGLLRAWRDSKNEHGIIYEIAVSREHRGQKHGRQLRDYLIQEKKIKGDWKGNAARVVPNLDRHLGVVRTIYAVALTFGFQKVVDSTFLQFFGHLSPPKAGDPFVVSLPFDEKIVLLLLFAALGLLGIRFFWATGNIRRYMLLSVVRLRPPTVRQILFVHFPFLVTHAVLFFFLCRFYQDFALKGIAGCDISGTLLVFLALLALNCIWLFLLRRGSRDNFGPEPDWQWNNGIFLLVGICILLVFYCGGMDPELRLAIAASLILLNSMIDLKRTGGSYILGDAFGGA